MSGAGQFDPYQEMPPRAPVREAWAEPPPPGPHFPSENLGEWLGEAWRKFSTAPRELILVQVVVTLLSGSSAGVLMGPMLAGYFRYAIRRSRDEKADFNDLFSAANQRFLTTFIVGLIVIALGASGLSILTVLDMIAASIPLVGSVLRGIVDLVAGAALATLLGTLSFLFPLVHEKNITLQQAVDVLVVLWRNDWKKAAIGGLVVGGLPLIGLLVMGVGMVITGPLAILVAARAYRALFEGVSITTFLGE